MPRRANFARQFGLCIYRSYSDKGDEILAKVSTQRHNYDPGFKPLFGTDMITLTLKGTATATWSLRSTRAATARRRFQAVLTRIGD